MAQGRARPDRGVPVLAYPLRPLLLTSTEAPPIFLRHRQERFAWLELRSSPALPGVPPVAPRSQTDALRGSLDLLVLKTLSLEPMHGWGISQRVQQLSHGVLEVNQGSLYPALQRLEKSGLVTSDWQTTENNRRARYYRLTAAGRRALGTELEDWKRFADALQRVLQAS